MSGEAIGEAIATRLRQTLTGRPAELADSYAADLVDYLRGEGWEFYRPADHIVASVDGYTICPIDNLPAALGQFRLIPVKGET